MSQDNLDAMLTGAVWEMVFGTGDHRLQPLIDDLVKRGARFRPNGPLDGNPA